MYKKVTHNITEEHFEHPMAAKLFGSGSYTRPNTYPNGTAIPESLPPSYQPAWMGQAPKGQTCSTCQKFDASTRQCSLWQARVKPLWWCAAWENNMPQKVNSAWMLINDDADVITTNVPLMIRIMEYAREETTKDTDLHAIAEKLVEMTEEQGVLTMDHYQDIVGNTMPAYMPEAK